MTGPTEAYFLLPQNSDWASTAGGVLTVITNTVGTINVSYSTTPVDLDNANISSARALTWQSYSGGSLPNGITALKFYSSSGLVNGNEYVATFEFTTPDVDVKTVPDNSLAVGRTIYDLGKLNGGADIRSDNGRTAAVSLTRPEYTVFYNANNGVNPAPTFAQGQNPFNGTEIIQVLGNETTRFTKSNYVFTGWNTEANGGGNSYAKNNNLQLSGQNVILYAQWRLLDRRITYYSNGGTGIIPEATIHPHGSSAILKSADTLQRTGYEFVGWAESASAISAAYNAGGNIASVERDYNLYAIWKIRTFTVVFKDFDGSTLKTQVVSYGSDATAPSKPSRAGYVFSNWDKAYTNIKSDVTVTAQYNLIHIQPPNSTNPTNPPEPEDPIITDPPPGEVVYEPTEPEAPDVVPSTLTKQQEVVAVAKDAGIAVLPIGNDGVPLVAPNGVAAWALFNLVLMFLTILFALCGIIFAIRRRSQNDEAKETRTRKVPFITTIASAIISALVFFITEDMSLPTVVFDKWTIVMAVILIAEIVGLVFTKRNVASQE
jgi:uncharacterized repeat protein (TIGR02543 family)